MGERELTFGGGVYCGNFSRWGGEWANFWFLGRGFLPIPPAGKTLIGATSWNINFRCLCQACLYRKFWLKFFFHSSAQFWNSPDWYFWSTLGVFRHIHLKKRLYHTFIDFYTSAKMPLIFPCTKCMCKTVLRIFYPRLWSGVSMKAPIGWVKKIWQNYSFWCF